MTKRLKLVFNSIKSIGETYTEVDFRRKVTNSDESLRLTVFLQIPKKQQLFTSSFLNAEISLIPICSNSKSKINKISTTRPNQHLQIDGDFIQQFW
jgi:hypothetical protein